MPRRLVLALACSTLSLASIVCLAQAPPSADAYVTNARPAANFGSSVISRYRLEPRATFSSISGPCRQTSMAKATLRLYVNAVAAPGSFDVDQVNVCVEREGYQLQ